MKYIAFYYQEIDFFLDGISESLYILLWICYLGKNQFSSVAQSCPTLCYPMDFSTSGFPVHHQLPELAQTHVHLVGDAI